MPRKSFLVVCLVALTSVAAFAGSIPFSGSGGSGTIQTGQPFAYNADGGTVAPDWGIPGVNLNAAFWSGPTISQFMVTFALPAGVIIDPAQIIIGNGGNCFGTSNGGTTFCAGPYSTPWTATLIGTNEIVFNSSGDLLTAGDTFFVNVFFSGGDPYGAAFSGEFTPIPIPEPATPMILGSGLFALCAGLRRKLVR